MPKRGDEFCCNKCGRFCIFDLDDDECTSNLFHNMSVYFGYTSPFDNEKIEFTLCELCLFEFWRGCKHKPSSEYYKNIVEGYDSARSTKHLYYEDLFIETYKNLEDVKKK